jgi:hypothetical protein
MEKRGRRTFIFAGVLALVGILKRTKTAPFFFEYADQGMNWICVVTIGIPPGLSMNDYVITKNSWIKLAKLDDLEARFLASGLLLDKNKSYSSNQIEFRYIFKDKNSYNKFITQANSLVDHNFLRSLGYEYSRKAEALGIESNSIKT